MTDEQYIKLREDNAVIKETLKGIHEQTIRTNGRMSRAEQDIQELQKADINLRNKIDRNSDSRGTWKEWLKIILSAIISAALTLIVAFLSGLL